MRISRKLLLAILVLCAWPLLALGALDRIEEAYELTRDEVTLPAHSASQVVIRQCSDCDPVMHPVNSATVYQLGRNPENVGLAALRSAAAEAPDALLLVFYAPETGVVTRIALR